MTLPKLSPLSAGVAVTLFLLGCGASFLGLGLIARPSNFAPRVATAEQLTTAKESGGSRRFPDSAVCTQATIPASQALRGVLTELAGRHNITLQSLQTAPAAPDRALQGLSAIDVQIAATGSQTDALALIVELERTSPAVFVDALELRPKGGAFALTLAGRAFCSIPTRL